MTVAVALSCSAVLLAIAVVAVFIARRAFAVPLVYGACCAASLVTLLAALRDMVVAPMPGPPARMNSGSGDLRRLMAGARAT